MTEKDRERGSKAKESKSSQEFTPLSGDVNHAFTKKLGGKSINEIVAQTLYGFCQGMKVCVEIVLMAADSGLIPVNREVIANAGTDEGADTAIVSDHHIQGSS